MHLAKLKDRNRRAITPIIATVLLIGIVIAAAAIIFVWSKKFIGENIQKYGDNINSVCDRLKYESSIDALAGGNYEITINNQGNDNIHQINLKFIKTGSSVVRAYTPEGGMIAKGTSGKLTISASTSDLPDNMWNKDTGLLSAQKIEVTPVLLGVGQKTMRAKLSTCSSQTQTLKLS